MTRKLNLSLEEIEDLYSDTEQAIKEESQNAQRVSDTVYALECLCETLENKETLSEDDVLRLRTADMFAATGTDAEPGEIVPAFEAHTSSDIALEGIIDNIQNGIASLAQSSKAINFLVEKRIASLSTLILTFEKRQETLADLLSNTSDRKKSISIKLDYSAEGLKIKNFQQYLGLIESNTKDIEHYVKIHTSVGEDLHRSILATFASFVNARYSQTLTDTYNLFNTDVLEAAAKNWNEVQSSSRLKKKQSSEFYGGKVIEHKISKDTMNVDDSRGIKRELIDNIGWKLTNTEELHGNRIKETVTFDNVSTSDIEKLHNCNRRIVNALQSYHSNKSHVNQNQRRIYEIVTNIFAVNKQVRYALANYKQYIGILDAIVKGGSASTISKVAFVTGGAVATGGVVYGIAKLNHWLRRMILAWVFTTMKLQYRITDYMGFVDSRVIGLAISTTSHNFTIVNRYVK